MMVNKSYKNKVSKLIEKSEKKGLIKKYSEFCKTESGKQTKLSKDEINYYTSNKKGDVDN